MEIMGIGQEESRQNQSPTIIAAESTGFGRDLFSLQRFAGIGEKDSSRLKHLRFRGETSRFLFPFLEGKERVPKHNQKWPIFC